jgi:hypothetical protein
MADTADRPLLYLDVDGPLIPFGARHPDCPPRPTNIAAPGTNPLLSRLDPNDGQHLLALRCELVWATSWMSDANDIIAPLLGLPALPLVEWPDEDVAIPHLHWKTNGLVSWSAGRAFVWIDDEITDADRAWVMARHPGPALLHRVDPSCGLTAADFSAIEDWLRNH